jgi:hypothetical protein
VIALAKLISTKSQEAFPSIVFVRIVMGGASFDHSRRTYLGTMRSVASNIFFVVGNIQELALRTRNRERKCLLTNVNEVLYKLSLLDLLR